ncbi:GGDEF domain-containing protein [Aurantiacibacter sp. D1-12]|uniref:GGDEF domain-containing protein n=1 Tax=Aurantiacibacter sp. D1-12 TaxID=2993658 RepID=UPI00237CA9D5|nr:GGDEF domain-containing protein [Aurantiacibacter sp. D1-12]MDE1467239.1 GGDEF domain-containing protein [Aurantiacibacter sp. D1-12]
MYLLFTVALAIMAMVDKRLVTARWAALGFFVAFTSISVDGYREPGGDTWVSWFTVATHFLPLLIMVQAFLTRHGRNAPRWVVAFAGFSCIYVMPDMPWEPENWFRGVYVQATCMLIIASGLPFLWRKKTQSKVDIFVFFAMFGASMSYLARAIVIYARPIGETREEALAFYEGLNIIFHSASALMGMTMGIVLMMTIGFDMLMGRTKEVEIDPLTKTGNRRKLDRRITDDSNGKNPVGAVLVIDLDHFKRVNDLFGHDAGDDVLHAVGSRLTLMFKGIGTVCRTGGEEFVILIRQGSADSASALALTVRSAIASLEFDGVLAGYALTASVGFHRRTRSQSLAAAIRLADQAVYCAKKNGRNRVVGAINENGLNVLRAVA